MLNAKANQFSLSPEGLILWQAKPESPLPGVPVAKLVKGEHALRPGIEVLENEWTKNVERAELRNNLALWLNTYIGNVLEPLVFLGVQEAAPSGDPVQDICKTLYDSLGVVPRETLEPQIEKLDHDQRAVLRSKKIRLGPILVFIPLLNKPAAVRLRGLLWSVEKGKPLPAPVPADGIVSVEVDESAAAPDFYRAVGYPLYGGRAVRIDMLDRVINLIYEKAEKGKFSAQHQMAEWLGCSIESLYKVLESMGHTKIYDPADDAAKMEVSALDGEASAAAPLIKKEEESVDNPTALEEVSKTSEEGDSSDRVDTQVADDPHKQQKKPELAVFRLKRGKAFEPKKPAGKLHSASRKGSFKADSPDQSSEEGGSQRRKPPKSEKGRKGHKKGGRMSKHHKDFDRDDDREARVISFEAKRKDEDSPFAILQKLKVKGDD